MSEVVRRDAYSEVLFQPTLRELELALMRAARVNQSCVNYAADPERLLNRLRAEHRRTAVRTYQSDLKSVVLPEQDDLQLPNVRVDLTQRRRWLEAGDLVRDVAMLGVAWFHGRGGLHLRVCGVCCNADVSSPCEAIFDIGVPLSGNVHSFHFVYPCVLRECTRLLADTMCRGQLLCLQENPDDVASWNAATDLLIDADDAELNQRAETLKALREEFVCYWQA